MYPVNANGGGTSIPHGLRKATNRVSFNLLCPYCTHIGCDPEFNLWLETVWEKNDGTCWLQQLSLPGFETAQPAIATYFETIHDDRKNSYAELDDGTKDVLQRKWSRSFAEWGYAL